LSQGLAAEWTGPLELAGAAFFEDPYPLYARLREMRAPVFHEPTQSWLVSRYADCEAVLRDPRVSKQVVREVATPFDTSVLFRDPPAHGRIRGLLNQVFAGMPEDLDARVGRIANGLIDRMLAAGSADFIRDFALPLPVAVIAEMLGVPAGDAARLHAWSSDFIIDEGVSEAESQQRQYAAMVGMGEYFAEMIARAPGEGMVAAMLRAGADGDRLTADELVGNCVLLMVAGHETTVNLLGNGMLLFLSEPGRVAEVKGNEKLLGTAIDEVLRFESPVQLGTFRVTIAPIEVGGRTIEPGAMVTALIGAANRDAEQFAQPDVFDMARTNNRHLGFGFGPHRCIGAQLARAEARVGFSRLFERMPGLMLAPAPRGWLAEALARVGLGAKAGPAKPHWRRVAVTRGLTTLPVTF
jgi:cytochrome P450